MIVVSDTSAITSLIQIGREGILPKLFARVIIPSGVRDELLEFHQTVPAFLEIMQVRDVRKVNELLLELDRGESEAIVLAKENQPDYFLVDDLAARNVAIGEGLPVIGLLGVLLKAKRSQLIGSLKEIIDELETKAGFRISIQLRADVLEAAGEL
jgi:predicted nucleic acid-binding protein